MRSILLLKVIKFNCNEGLYERDRLGKGDFPASESSLSRHVCSRMISEVSREDKICQPIAEYIYKKKKK